MHPVQAEYIIKATRSSGNCIRVVRVALARRADSSSSVENLLALPWKTKRERPLIGAVFFLFPRRVSGRRLADVYLFFAEEQSHRNSFKIEMFSQLIFEIIFIRLLYVIGEVAKECEGWNMSG